MTFEEWTKNRKWIVNADKELNPELYQNKSGFQYPDGAVIILGYVQPNNWYTVSGRDEIDYPDLNQAEKWLWDNHSSLEMNNEFDEEEAQLISGFKLFCEQNNLKYESMDEVHAVLMIQMHNKELEFKQSKKLYAECSDWMNKWINMIERRNAKDTDKALKSIGY